MHELLIAIVFSWSINYSLLKLNRNGKRDEEFEKGKDTTRNVHSVD